MSSLRSRASSDPAQPHQSLAVKTYPDWFLAVLYLLPALTCGAGVIMSLTAANLPEGALDAEYFVVLIGLLIVNSLCLDLSYPARAERCRRRRCRYLGLPL